MGKFLTIMILCCTCLLCFTSCDASTKQQFTATVVDYEAKERETVRAYYDCYSESYRDSVNNETVFYLYVKDNDNNTAQFRISEECYHKYNIGDEIQVIKRTAALDHGVSYYFDDISYEHEAILCYVLKDGEPLPHENSMTSITEEATTEQSS